MYNRCKNLTKQLVASIVKNSVVLMKASKKNTLTQAMVLFEAQRQGHTIYWTDAGGAAAKKQPPKVSTS